MRVRVSVRVCVCARVCVRVRVRVFGCMYANPLQKHTHMHVYMYMSTVIPRLDYITMCDANPLTPIIYNINLLCKSFSLRCKSLVSMKTQCNSLRCKSLGSMEIQCENRNGKGSQRARACVRACVCVCVCVCVCAWARSSCVKLR